MIDRKRLGAAVAVTMLAACVSAQAATISTFDDDREGWTATGDVASFTQEPTGGNPGGWLRIVDATSGPIFYLHAPGTFLGDRSSANGTTMSFDALRVSSSGSTLAAFGTVTLTSSTDSASLDFGGVPPLGEWQTYSQPLTAAAWGKTEGDWLALLSDLTALQINMEMISGADTVGFDNFTFVPEPGSTALLAIGGLALLARRSGRHGRSA